jgi:transposase
MAYIGIDLHTDRFTEARLSAEDGKVSMRKQTYTFDRGPFQRFLESLHTDDYVLIENTSNAFWLHDLIIDRVKACYVYDTNELRTDGNKTDKIDAEKLAKKMGYYIMMGCEEKEFPTVYVPEEKVRELRGLLTTYRFYNKMKAQMKNRIHSILKQNGIRRKKSQITIRPFEKWLDEVELAEIWKAQIRLLLAGLEANEAQRQDVKDMIVLRGSELFGEQIEILLSIRGFSAFTAIVLMCDIVDVDRFSSAKKFCSYLRVAPTTKASNQTVHVGSVNRQSRSATCSLLTQSVMHFSEIGPHIGAFHQRVKVGKSAGKVRIAMIRKVLVCAYNMLKKNETCHWIDRDLYARKLKDFHKDLARLTQQRDEEEKKIA